MLLTIKEQLVLMRSFDMNPKDIWPYLTYLIERNILNEPRKIKDCQNILNILKDRQLVKNIPNLLANRLSYEIIQSWSKNAVMVGEELYPKLWSQLPQAPVLFFYEGDLSILNKPLVTIIGTRQITSYGQKITQELTKALVKTGFGLVSGLSDGVNVTCQETGLNTGTKSQIAITPAGINYFYPYKNQILQKRVMTEGLLISEFCPNSKPDKENFIMVNRMMAGISPATILIEASKKSGAMITANYALQFNREVFALPGRVDEVSAQGCNELINDGARMLLSVEQAVFDLVELYQSQGFM